MQPLSIIYQDDYLVAINKPTGLLVHRSALDKYEKYFAVQILRNQLGQIVFPIHRLDKPTSGILLFALDKQSLTAMSNQWQQVEKTYTAITRGYLTNTLIDHPITTQPEGNDSFTTPKHQEAQTQIDLLKTCTLDIGFGKNRTTYPKTTFSWVNATPKTGRKHQIRKHLKHISHPIVGDTRYGKGDINRYFREHYQIHRLMLHCQQMAFSHPVSDQPLVIQAPLDEQWQHIIEHLFEH